MLGSVLVDSSFYISRLRAGVDPLQELAQISEDWEIVTCGIVVVEVCRGFKTEKLRQRFEEAFSTMILIPTTPKLWHQAMELAWKLDRQGKIMQVTDLTIAACALQVDAAVLTLDGDFDRVPNLQVFTQLPG
jgi:tRNA(fMet)-specific endonuclease VapC